MALTACTGEPSTGASDADTGSSSVTVSTCGHAETVRAPPKRVVVNTRGLVEVLAALGVADRVQEYSTLGHSHYEPLNGYQQAVAAVPHASEGTLSKEEVVSQNPDLFYSDMNYDNTMIDDYEPLDIPVLFATRWCPTHAPTEHGDPDVIAGQYHDLADLGRLFHVEDTASDLIGSLKKRIAHARAIATGNAPLTAASVAFYDGPGGRMTVNQSGMIDQLIGLAGGDNVYSAPASGTGDTSSDVSAESLIEKDPDVIIIRETGHGDYDTVRHFFRHDKRFQDISAVQHDRFTTIHHSEALAGIQFPNAAVRLATAFHNFST